MMYSYTRFLTRLFCTGLLTMAVACGDDEEETPMQGEGGEEVITTMNITLSDGMNTITGRFFDADGEGGAPGVTTDPGPLMAGTTYALEIELLNESEVPAEDVTEEIEEEAEEHQFFYEQTGDVVSVMIDDVESQYNMDATAPDLPVGLSAQVEAIAAGSGTLKIVLKHLPPANDGTILKTGNNDINVGSTDIEVTFDITVQ